MVAVFVGFDSDMGLPTAQQSVADVHATLSRGGVLAGKSTLCQVPVASICRAMGTCRGVPEYE
jgi:hypothetical protein